jgi:hypothetical protein
VVVDHVQHDRKAVDVTEVYQRLQLVHLAAQILDRVPLQPPGVQQLVDPRDVRRELVVCHRVVHLRGEIVRPVVAEAEPRLKLLDRQQLHRGDAQSGEVRQLARHVQKRARPSRQVRGEEGPDVQLVDDEITKGWRDVAGLVPGEIGLANNTLAGERRL